jgi:hypothetical protein
MQDHEVYKLTKDNMRLSDQASESKQKLSLEIRQHQKTRKAYQRTIDLSSVKRPLTLEVMLENPH